VRGQRPGGHTTAHQRDELASPHGLLSQAGSLPYHTEVALCNRQGAAVLLEKGGDLGSAHRSVIDRVFAALVIQADS
jgi:hypothetical protein